MLKALPLHVGVYRLARTYAAYDTNRRIVLALGDYLPEGDSQPTRGPLTVGLWVASAQHTVRLSNATRGTSPTSTTFFEAKAQSVLPVHSVTFVYTDRTMRRYDAETNCSEEDCSDGMLKAGSTDAVLVFPGIDQMNLNASHKRLPILVRRTGTDLDSTSSMDSSRKFEDDVRALTQALNISILVRQVGSKP